MPGTSYSFEVYGVSKCGNSLSLTVDVDTHIAGKNFLLFFFFFFFGGGGGREGANGPFFMYMLINTFKDLYWKTIKYVKVPITLEYIFSELTLCTLNS